MAIAHSMLKDTVFIHRYFSHTFPDPQRRRNDFESGPGQSWKKSTISGDKQNKNKKKVMPKVGGPLAHMAHKYGSAATADPSLAAGRRQRAPSSPNTVYLQ